MLRMRTRSKRRVRARSAWLAVSILVGLASKVPAQAPSSDPATLLEIQIQNNVTYWDDVADLWFAKNACGPNARVSVSIATGFGRPGEADAGHVTLCYMAVGPALLTCS